MNDAILPLFQCHGDDVYGQSECDRRRFQSRLDALGIRYKSLYVGSDGTFGLNLAGTIITDLSPLAALPLTHLCLQGCREIAHSVAGRVRIPSRGQARTHPNPASGGSMVFSRKVLWREASRRQCGQVRIPPGWGLPGGAEIRTFQHRRCSWGGN
jgi:hypothetical protein